MNVACSDVIHTITDTKSWQLRLLSVPGAFSFKQILGLSKLLDPLFQARRGSKPRLPGLGGPKLAKNRKLNSPVKCSDPLKTDD